MSEPQRLILEISDIFISQKTLCSFLAGLELGANQDLTDSSSDS